MEHISNSTSVNAKNFKMIYTFTVHVQKVELLIIEEELFLKDNQSSDSAFNSTTINSDDNGTNRSVDNISILTEDDVQSLQINQTGDGNNEDVDPNALSTDYLLFDIPKRTLLRLEMTQLKCSILGDSSTSRCLSFCIGHVKAVGSDHLILMSIGQGDDNVAPLGEVVISSNGGYASTNQQRRSSKVTHDALLLSLVISPNHTFLQCDAPTIQACVDITTIKNLLSFHYANAATLPKPLLERKAHETVRLYVLKQNKVEFPDLNCSVRIQGCDISLLREAKTTGTSMNSVENSSATETISQLLNVKSTVSLRCNMIEMYSGSAVMELSDLMDEWQSYGMPSASIGVSSKVDLSNLTRRLSMLDLPVLVAESPAMLCFHSVRLYFLSLLFSHRSDKYLLYGFGNAGSRNEWYRYRYFSIFIGALKLVS
jgi:hypothetical protein